jgi:hypothetical protein
MTENPVVEVIPCSHGTDIRCINATRRICHIKVGSVGEYTNRVIMDLDIVIVTWVRYGKLPDKGTLLECHGTPLPCTHPSHCLADVIRKVHGGEEFFDEFLTIVLLDGHEVINPMKVKNPILMRVVLLKEFHIKVALLHNRTLEGLHDMLIDIFMHLAPKSWVI